MTGMYKSTFMGMNTALRGLMAHQAALDVTGHNIANLNTEGYTRQRAEMVTSIPWSTPGNNASKFITQLGTGVQVNSLERLRDAYVDQNVRQQFGLQASAGTTVGQMQQIDAAFGEPSNGLSNLINDYYAKLNAVAEHADDISARQAFASSAANLATGLNQLSSNLTAIGAQSDVRLNDTVAQINGITTDIAALNTEIRDAIAMGQQPNDLLDRRDLLMDQLSQKINYSYTTAANGEVTITLGTTTPINLVDPTAPGGMTALTRADLDTAYTNGDLTAGSAYADEAMFNTVVPGLITQLDNLAAAIVTQTNTANAAGFDLNGTPGGNIFNPAGVTAATIALDPANNIATNPRLVAAASSWNAPGEPGNGANAAAMLTARTAVVGPPLNATIEGYYRSIVTGMGAQGAAAQRTLENQSALVDLATSRRASVSAVSLDEEMSNMLKFQNAYNASARVLTTMDDAIDTIINRMGRVGL